MLTFTFMDVTGGCKSNFVQLSEISFFDDDNNAIGIEGIHNPRGVNPSSEEISNLVDSNPYTKWLDRSMLECNFLNISLIFP